MESQPNLIGMPEEKKRGLVSEHAFLAAQYAQSNEPDLIEQMKKIEKTLAMSPGEIATLAISYYKEQYRY